MLTVGPDIPSVCTSDDRTTTSITLSWPEAPGATRYSYVFKTSSATDYGSAVDVPTGTTAPIDSLAPGTCYNFKVTAHGPDAVGNTVECSICTRMYIEQTCICAVSTMTHKCVETIIQ